MAKLSEEQQVQLLEETSEYLKVYTNIPYSLLYDESSCSVQDTIDEINQICKFYKIYKKGKDFTVEGTNGDYVPAKLKYKMAASLINKEARFLFAEQPDIKVEPKGDVGKVTPETKTALTVMNDLLETVLSKNKFEDILIKAARDCFIGKRVGCLVNFNEEDGITINFLKSTQFIYETKVGNQNVITKFVCFIVAKDSTSLAEKRIFKKKFTLERDGFAYIEESMYDGAGSLVENITKKQPTKLNFIPAFVIINDGLSGEALGESEVELLMDYEMWYSKLSNADKDAERKSMNPTKYVIDMENNSTKSLSTAAGALWDLGSDQNLENQKTEVGILEPHMYYSEALKTSLERIKTAGYEQVDVPNITSETLSGSITSGKALKAIYWPLIVRCKEKMKVWGPGLKQMADIIIQGAMTYPNCIKQYVDFVLTPVAYEVSVEQNTPLPEDEIEEKTTNLAEVEASVMSKKTYMKRWYNLTDDEVSDELRQIALERQILDDYAYDLNNGYNGDNKFVNPGDEEFNMAGVNSIKSDGTDRHHNNGISKEKQAEMDADGDIEESFSGGQQITTHQSMRRNLNASQTSSMIKVITQYKAGTITLNQAVSIMQSMGLDEAFARKILMEKDGIDNVVS
nr:MAG TPA: PORTAL PROTEIN [Caudoviricetes sp.]